MMQVVCIGAVLLDSGKSVSIYIDRADLDKLDLPKVDIDAFAKSLLDSFSKYLLEHQKKED